MAARKKKIRALSCRFTGFYFGWTASFKGSGTWSISFSSTSSDKVSFIFVSPCTVIGRLQYYFLSIFWRFLELLNFYLSIFFTSVGIYNSLSFCRYPHILILLACFC